MVRRRTKHDEVNKEDVMGTDPSMMNEIPYLPS